MLCSLYRAYDSNTLQQSDCRLFYFIPSFVRSFCSLRVFGDNDFVLQELVEIVTAPSRTR